MSAPAKIIECKRVHVIRIAMRMLCLTVAMLAPALAGEFSLRLRSRVELFKGSGEWQEVNTERTLDTRHTAIIICDMWDHHWCAGAERRVVAMAPRMADVIGRARAKGILIIHAPSETMEFYKDYAQRKWVLSLPQIAPPPGLNLDSPPLPIDDSDEGCDTGQKVSKPYPWTRENALIPIAANDAVTDKGTEVYSLLRARDIHALLIMGVHANMCILRRSFAIKQMTRWGVPCILVRDLTDAMYNPERRPWVTHERGTGMVIEYIEKYWGPTALGTDLTAALTMLPDAAAAARNLLENAEWSFAPARPDLAPEAGRESGPVLRMKSRGYQTYGKWIAVAKGIRPGAAYRIEAPYTAEGIPNETTSVAAIVSWCEDEAGKKPLQRDYLPREAAGLARTLTAPAKAQTARIELILRWADTGSVDWKAPRLFETAALPPRKARVVTTHIKPPPATTIDANLKLMCDMLDRVAELKPDLVLFSENMAQENVHGSLAERAQTIPGPITDTLAQRAGRYHTYVATTLTERAGDLFYNTAVLFDRQGRIAGRYRKVHLPLGEGESGITPGRDYPVFDTDFARIGILTCWDNWFPETARILRLAGAEILLHPVEGDLEKDHWEVIPRARAIDNGVYYISSSLLGAGPSQIIDPQGRLLAATSEPFAYVWQDIDIDATSRVRFLSVGNAEGEPKSLYIQERRPDTYGPLGSAR